MSQETKNYQYERNDFNTYGVRGSATGGGTEVVANPEGTATTDLTKLKVDDTIYGIPEVVPNNVEIVDCTSGSLPSGVTYSSLSTLMQTKVVVVKWTWNTKILEGIVTQAPSGYSGLRASAFIETAENIGYYITLSINQNDTLNMISSNAYTFSTPKYNFEQPIASASNLTRIHTEGQVHNIGAYSTYAFTTAPTANNIDGGIRLVVLTSEPSTYYNGYYYIIAPTT